MNGEERRREQAVTIDLPRGEDVSAIAQLFFEDMQTLGVSATREDLEQLACEVVDQAQQKPPLCLCWVARVAGSTTPVGVVLANFNWSLKFAGKSLWIEELYVTPSARRRSIGRLLVEKLLDYAEENGIKGVDIEAYQGNTPASILYRSLGFHRLGRDRFYYRLGPDEYL